MGATCLIVVGIRKAGGVTRPPVLPLPLPVPVPLPVPLLGQPLPPCPGPPLFGLLLL